ncbi:MAG: hypothetical protein KJO43_01830, partial [Phycisphaerae bacterium]|nr:hypothetical protein [Phycisphaerae bacterium]
ERTRLGIVCSSEGGVVDALASMRGPDTTYEIAGVVTDRGCGVEAVATRHAIPVRRIVEPDRDRFSSRVAGVLETEGVDVVVLLFTRLVGPAVWRDFPGVVWNLHPSLLPRHRGLGALARSYADAGIADPPGVTMPLGVTLHHVTGETDAGAVIAQGRFGRAIAPTLEVAAHVSFLLKLALLREALADGVRDTPPAVPVTEQPWHGHFRGLVPRPGVLTAVGRWARPPVVDWVAELGVAVTP